MKILSCLFTCIVFLSCGKEKNYPFVPSSTSGLIQYKVNGQLVVMDNADTINKNGVSFAKQLKGFLPETRYFLNAQKNGVDNSFVTSIVTDSLQLINYHYDSAYMHASATATFAFTYDGQGGAIYYKGDYLDVNIFSYKNARVSGTFSAKLTPLAGILDYNNRSSVIITEGILDNVPVSY
jgi:hypothetical protein